MVSATTTTIATANPKKIIENRNKDMDIEKGNEETHTHKHKDCFGENIIKIKMIMIMISIYIFMAVFNLWLLYMTSEQQPPINNSHYLSFRRVVVVPRFDCIYIQNPEKVGI